jgi:hypothetical protein
MLKYKSSAIWVIHNILEVAQRQILDLEVLQKSQVQDLSTDLGVAHEK